MKNTSARILDDNRFRFWTSLSLFAVCALLNAQNRSNYLLAETLLFLSYSCLFGLVHVFAIFDKAGAAANYFLLAVDTVVITAAIALTGGSSSPLYILYLIVFGITIYRRSLPNFVFSAVLSGLLYVGLILYTEPITNMALFALSGQLVLMTLLTGVLYAVLLSMVKERRARKRLVQRIQTKAKIAEVLSGTVTSARDCVRAVSSLIEEEIVGDGLKCRISIHSGNQTFIPPSGGGFGVHIPIQVGSAIMGTMVITREQKKPLSLSEQDFFSSIARSLGLSLHRLQIWEGFQERLKKIEASLLLNVKDQEISAQTQKELRSDYQNVEMMLDVILMERGRWKLEKEPCHVIQIFGDEVRDAKRLAKDKNVDVSSDSKADDALKTNVDPLKLKVLFSYLLTRAVVASPANEQVSVQVRQEKDVVSFMVKDNGMALPQEKMDEILQKKEMLTEASINGEAISEEMGLYVCKKIVEAHGGRIWAQSNYPKAGREIGFRLPIDVVPQLTV